MNTVAAFSGFSVKNLEQAKDFYENVLGLEIEDEKMGLKFKLPSGGTIFIYEKPDHMPANYTILNLVVQYIDSAVDELVEKGVQFETYDNLFPDVKQDAKGILRSPDPLQYGPSIAWFKDPSGNTIAILEDGQRV